MLYNGLLAVIMFRLVDIQTKIAIHFCIRFG